VSEGFYLTYAGPYPDLSELRSFWRERASRGLRHGRRPRALGRRRFAGSARRGPRRDQPGPPGPTRFGALIRSLFRPGVPCCVYQAPVPDTTHGPWGPGIARLHTSSSSSRRPTKRSP
jgi:hypothetical protein